MKKKLILFFIFLIVHSVAFADENTIGKSEQLQLKNSNRFASYSYREACIDGLRFIVDGNGNLIQVFVPVDNKVSVNLYPHGSVFTNTIVTSVPAKCK